MLKNLLSPFESGNFEVAPSALEQSRDRYFEIIRAVTAIDQATKDLFMQPSVEADSPFAIDTSPIVVPATYDISDVVPLTQQEFNQQTIYDLAFRKVMESYGINTAPASPATVQPQSTSIISDEHPNQAAIEEAYLAAMAAYDSVEVVSEDSVA